MDRFAEAVRDFQTAITLRPNDYLLWLRLAYAREKLDDQPGALVAYREAVHLAPSYATCHWYLGRLLLRMRAREEAFVEFRRATNTDPELFPSVINYAWREFGEDADLVRQAVGPQESSEYLMLAQGFLTRGKRSDAMAMYHAAGKISGAERRLFLAQLLEAKAYVEAYEVWAVGQGVSIESREGTLSNAGFEKDVSPTALGFEWQVPRTDEQVRAVLDDKEPQTGAHSLRVSFNGNSTSEANIVSQIVIVEANALYRLAFAARAQNLITGGLPVVAILDANNGQVLARSKPIPEKTSGWQNHMVEFKTANSTHAIIVAIRREACIASCPAFGLVWFDSFSCQKL